jgi:xanthine dehydrogenase accessory factor
VYDIALSVAACARSGTRADVAWMVAPVASDEALAFTPGGGRIGYLASGAFDGLLADVAARQLSRGRRVHHVVTEVESAQCGLAVGTEADFLVIPAAQFPAESWQYLLDRRPVAFTVDLDGDDVGAVIVETGDAVAGLGVEVRPGSITTSLAPVPRLVVAGAGPIADALVEQGRLLGWKVVSDPRPDTVAGFAAALSPLDAVVVMGHDVETSSRCLMSALESDAGYVGALGSRAMQQSRADWLAYRDVTDLSRVHGPAGLDIGARGPREIAVSIVAEVIGVLARS